ncbi:MAG: tetratricopeptide repeat protein [Dongiaceae bacterium]
MRDEADRLLNNALYFHRQGRLDEAHDIYRQVIRDNPDHAHAHHLLGLVTRHRGQERDANRYFQRAAEIAPEEALYRATLADSHRQIGDDAAARRELEAIEALAFDDPELRIQVATIWGLIGENAVALDRCRPVIAMFPDHLRGNLLLGSLLSDRGEFGDALAALDKVRTADPNLPDPSCALASTLFALGRYERILRLDAPPDPRQRFGEAALKATVLWLQGRAREAAPLVEASLAHEATLPDWPRKAVFRSMLDQLAGLLAFRARHTAHYDSAAHATLAVIGDEQAMAAAGYIVTIEGQSTRLIGEPVFGCRAAHLVGADNRGADNRFKAAYLAALTRVPNGSRFVSLIGSLDCRIAGLLAELPRSRHGQFDDLSPADQLATDYVDWLAETCRARNVTPIVAGTPATNVQVEVMKTLTRNAYLEIIERFNRALAAGARRHGFAFADLLAATRSGTAQGRPGLYIDTNHILPTSLVDALDRSEIRSAS